MAYCDDEYKVQINLQVIELMSERIAELASDISL